MALSMQINNDERKIVIDRFEETLNYKDEGDLSDPNSIRFLLDFDINTGIEDYTSIQNYLLQYVPDDSISSIKIYKDNNLLYSTTRYTKVEALYVRSDMFEKLSFTIHFEDRDEEIENND